METTTESPALPVAQAAPEPADERRGCTSASNAAADRGCEGRHQAQKGMEEPKSSVDATFGQKIHDALFKQDAAGIKDDAGALSIYDSCNEITTKAMKEVFGADYEKATVYRERRFWCNVLAQHGAKDPKPVRYEHSGKLDFIARLGTRGLILEYKTLPGDIDDSTTNEQVRDQVVLGAGTLVLKWIAAGIIQPLVTHKCELVQYNEESIKRAEQEMYSRVRNSNKPNPKRTPGKLQCKFCLARFTCTERLEWAAAQVPDTGSVAGKPCKDWTPEQRAHFLEMRPVAQAWLDECQAEMKRLAKLDATNVPGWTFRPGNIITKFTDANALFAKFRALAVENLKKEIADEATLNTTIQNMFMECVDIKKKELELKVRAVTGFKGQGLSKLMEQLEEGISSSKQNEESLVKAKIS